MDEFKRELLQQRNDADETLLRRIENFEAQVKMID